MAMETWEQKDKIGKQKWKEKQNCEVCTRKDMSIEKETSKEKLNLL